MNYYGIIIGISAFLIIGSLFAGNYVVSTLLGVVGFSCFWSIRELFEQEERVKKGWFPRNQKRKTDE